MNFSVIKTAVAKQFQAMQAHPMFRVDVDGDTLWSTYLASFPPGTNPIYRERTEHDCSCCRRFVRSVGNVVSIIGGRMVSVWDGQITDDPTYAAVTSALSDLVLSKPITVPFLHYEQYAGTDRNFEQILEPEESVRTWTHFFVNIDRRFVKPKADIPSILGERKSQHDVLLRSLMEISNESIDTVLDLIGQNSLYRGEEHKATVLKFKEAKQEFDQLPYGKARDIFAWTADTSGAVTRIRNTVIGTLLVDLSEGKDLEVAVHSFESKVAPTNYKRPSALITKVMIEKAKEKLSEMGLNSALDRRYARLSDITINNVLFADRATRKALSGDVFDELAEKATPIKNLDKIEEVPIDRFIAEILPRSESIEVMFENRHQGNLISLIAPSDPTARHLFKWQNNFSWSYFGELADSEMRKAVVARGGSVTGVFRFTHQWNYDKRNASLMDLHVFMPGSQMEATNGMNDSYGNAERVGWNHRVHAKSGGVQDVDYVQAAPVGYVPVENITFPDLGRMPEGRYVCKIHNWQLRAPTHGGFKAEIEFGGQIFDYEVDRPLKNKEWVTVAEVTLKGGVFTIKHHLPAGHQIKTIWGIPTQSFHRVNALMLSPNYWDDRAVGNKHFLFMLDGCRNDGTARGFFNEFLNEDLNQHRNVFEVVASKMKPADSDEQLSGLGFSSTQRNAVVCRVKGSFARTIKVVI